MSRNGSVESQPVSPLLGGWRDLLDDLGHLQRRIASVDGRCRCGHVAGSQPTCPCCGPAARDLVTACETCRRELADAARKVDRIEEDTVRFLPAVLDLFATMPHRYAAAVVVEHSFIRLLATFRRLHAVAGEWKADCPAQGLLVVKDRAEEVAIACRHFEAALNRLN